MIDKLQGIADRYDLLERMLSDPEIIADRSRYQKYTREHAELAPVVDAYRRYQALRTELSEARGLLNDQDPAIRAMARDEIQRLEVEIEALSDDLHRMLIPKDPADEKNVIIEVRAGTGGEEAALFAADLFRAYTRYAEAKQWNVEVMTHHATGSGGFKEIIAMITGHGAYSRLKYESGTHRVQRVPATETQGRIHTSAVTVAVLPEAEEIDVEIDPKDLKVDVYRSTGPGGQSVNTTDSAVRITHLPTGLVVTCQDEKSQHKNKAKALKVLRARLLDRMAQQQAAERSETRKLQVGTGDRSGRIRTYNFPQGRVTDHRIGLTLYKLDTILEGELDEIIEPLIAFHQAEALQSGHGLEAADA
ncbi:MAG TPA: peptide chain release factor 1 [Desulfobacteraceae bacterium]|nr:peptide chain release factor 1 [Deltaproteobacteria bacterium]MBW2355559.1 peptide chain release factor 1 [Deltaproteobacteria bacterium]RLB96919.1 MAG: peptide chain release factor 1 [Deltaproteobacteria bacterium]HDI60174.1 peptide chain release factor 1 [Desulfobacteraceae bacterium]